VFQRDIALDPKASRIPGEVRDRNAIVENVVNPAHALRSGFDVEGCLEKPLIIAVARAEHHPMLSQANWRAVGVGRDMFHSQNCHALSMECRAIEWSYISRCESVRRLNPDGLQYSEPNHNQGA
jgi:hypothetical protein